MKVYTIGRDASCHISLNDDLISRRHALLKVYATGKMEIVDTSSNGTYINNIRMASNASVPVTRKDVVSFARTRQLDWTLIPDPLRWVRWSLLGLFCLIVVYLFGTFICNMFSDSSIVPEGGQTMEMVNDTTKNKKTKILDSIGKAGSADSLKNNKSWYENEIRKSKIKKENRESEKNKEKQSKADAKKDEKKSEKKVEKTETKDPKSEPKVKETESQTNIVM